MASNKIPLSANVWIEIDTTDGIFIHNKSGSVIYLTSEAQGNLKKHLKP